MRISNLGADVAGNIATNRHRHVAEFQIQLVVPSSLPVHILGRRHLYPECESDAHLQSMHTRRMFIEIPYVSSAANVHLSKIRSNVYRPSYTATNSPLFPVV